MVFDKTKAMRNAERYLAQGKIRSAITEYRSVVDNDPKDFGTMNLLGDLYSKADEPKSAVVYYTAVAEHYSKQGFSQKAIAVYNKISKIQPTSVQVSERLAELYKTKGSVKEAKSHYVLLAESYQAKGRINEALAMWKQIALLDPNNTEVYMSIGELCLKEGMTADAADAFSEAGARFLKCGRTGDALNVCTQAIELDNSNRKAFTHYLDAAFATGGGDKAIEKFKTLYEEDKGNREVLSVLVDCYLRAGNAAEAEKAVVKLVELEPSNYPKLLDLAHYYLSLGDFDSASRMLSVASEHMLAGGQAEPFAEAVRTILNNDPDHLEALRLLVRFSTWQRDEDGLKESLQRLAKVAMSENSVEDERFALSQLVLLMPQEAAFGDRLRQLNAEHGFEDEPVNGKGLFDDRFFKSKTNSGGVLAGVINVESAPVLENSAGGDFAIVGAVIESANGKTETLEFVQPVFEQTVGAEEVEHSAAVEVLAEVSVDSTDARLRREVDSIKFYVDSGYVELAEKAIGEMIAEFGNIPEVAELSRYLNGQTSEAVSQVSEAASVSSSSGLFDIDELRSELGLEEPEAVDDSDFETKYNTAIAYQEMGLLEQAIAEFQDAAALVDPNDGTRRFFQCANLLGHCFMQNGMPKLAAKWYERTLEIKDLTSDEKQALWYELGIVHEAEGDAGTAERYFEQVYAENVDFRDVRSRLKNLLVAR
ncbi:MAG: tetratricopeptide repeat protein [Blastocatellia bacterium]|nr:tetratricopeptide repeat protein [Blastocatellia bacterium]